MIDGVDNTEDLTLPIEFGTNDSATFGLDYCSTLDFFDFITLGQFDVFHDIVIKSDNEEEGSEFITLTIQNPCFCEPEIFTLEIIDVPAIEVRPLVSDTACFASTRTLNAFIEGGGFPSVDRSVPPAEFEFIWSDTSGVISTDQSTVVDISQPGSYTYFLEVSDACNGIIFDTVNFVTAGIPDATLDGEFFICPESPEANLNITFEGAPPYTLFYTLDGVDQDPIVIQDPDFEFIVDQEGEYQITRIEAAGCARDLDDIAMVSNQSFSLDIAPTPTLCSDSEDGMLMAVISTGSTGTFEYLWSDPLGQTTEMAIGLAPGLYTVTVTDELGCTQELMQEVQAATPVSVMPALVNGTTCGDPNSGEISATGTGGTDVFDFEWFDNGGMSVGTGSSLGDLAAGVYEVVASDENGCEIRESITIPADEDTPVVFAVSTVIDCNNLSVTINTDGTSLDGVDGNFTYAWTINAGGGSIASGANEPNATVDAPGSYTLTVTNTDNGCTNFIPVMVTDNIVDPNPDAGSGFDCIDGAIQLGGPDLEVGDMITYQWTASNGGAITGPSDIANPMVSVAGTYEVLVTNMANGCTALEQVDVSEIPDVAVEVPANIDCRNGEVISLSGAGSEAGADITYAWTASNGGVIDTDDNTLNPIVSEGGTYTLTVTNSVTGCTNTMDITVDDVRADLVADPGQVEQINCNNQTLELGGGNTSVGGTIVYEWTIDTDAGTSSASSATITATAGGTYTLLVTDTNNGCTAMQEVVVTEDMTDPDVEIQMPALLTCQDPNQVLTSNGSSTGDFTYTWTTVGGNIVSSSSDPTAQVDDPGMYTLTIVNNLTGCDASESIEVMEDADFPVVTIATPANIDCDNTQVLLDGSGSDSGTGIEYTWRDDSGMVIGNTPSIQVAAGGQYILEVNNTLTGCVETDPVMVMDIRQDPVADPGDMQLLNCDVNAVTLGGLGLSTGPEFEYEWTLNSIPVSTEPNPEVMEGGEYTVLVTNTLNGCTAMEVVMVEQNTEDPEIDIEPSGIITCQDPVQTLLTDGSSSGTDFEFLWTGPDGFTSMLENPDIDVAGDYTLTITNTINRCAVTESLVVDVMADFPAIAIEDPAVVNCRDMIIELSGAGSEVGGAEIVYEWIASNGGVIDDDEDTLNPEISAAGTYTLTVSNTSTGCSRTLSIDVEDDFEDPVATVNPDLTFGCQDDFLNVSGVGSSTGPNFIYEWSATMGNISGDLNDISTQIDQPGEYTLLVTNMENGCTADASFSVIPDAALPQIELALPEMLTCDRMMILVNATGSVTDPTFIYEWRFDGVPFTPADNFMFNVEQPGMYTLIIEDPGNGCISEQSITVGQDIMPPLAEAGESITLNCQDMMLELDAGASSTGDDFEFIWTTANGGNIVSGEDTDEPLVDAPGDYLLTVRNTLTGCTSEDMVTVLQEITEPIIDFEAPLILNCRDESIPISAIVSDQGNNFDIEWTEMGTANIEDGEDSLTPTVNEPGTYVLTITNMDNFCVSTNEIVIMRDIEDPAIAIAVPEMLNCTTLDVALDGAGSSEGDEFTYEWSLLSGTGSFTGATDDILTSVNGPGVYLLTINNTSNFCVSTMQIVVDQDIDMPTAVTGAAQEVTCDNTEALLSGAGSSIGDEFQYIWTPLGGGAIVSGGTTLTPTVDSPGQYELTVINMDNGCMSTSIQSVTSNEIFPQEGPPVADVLNCELMEQVIASSGTPGFTYEWSTANGSIVGATIGSQIIVDMPGVYVLTITDDLTGCSTPNQFEIFRDIEDPDVDAGPTSELTCTEVVAALVGTGSEGNNFTYEWTTVDGSLSGPTDQLESQANASGTYTLTVFNNDNMCSSSADVIITVDESLPSINEPVVMEPFCFGDLGSISFENVSGGNPPYEYSIDGGATFFDSDFFGGLTPGLSYDLLIRDANGCIVPDQLIIPAVDSLSVTVAEDFVEIDLGESFNINAFTTFDPSEIVSITWSPETGLSCTDCLNPMATPGTGINYEVVVVSENGCVDQATIQFRVNRNIDIYIPNAFSPHNDDGVNDLFMPLGKQSIVARVLDFQIFDRWGEQVYFDADFELNDPARGWNGVFRNEDSPTGVYVYYVVIEFVDGSTELFEGDVTLIN